MDKEKKVSYNYDVSAWLKKDRLSPLREFHGSNYHEYTLKLDDDILPAFAKAKSMGKDTEHAVYYLRMHALHLSGDRIFGYKRIDWSGKDMGQKIWDTPKSVV